MAANPGHLELSGLKFSDDKNSVTLHLILKNPTDEDLKIEYAESTVKLGKDGSLHSGPKTKLDFVHTLAKSSEKSVELVVPLPGHIYKANLAVIEIIVRVCIPFVGCFDVVHVVI